MLGPSLHALKKNAEEAGVNPAYTARLLSVAKSLTVAQVPVVFSLMHLAVLSGASWSGLRASIGRERDDYWVFEIRKRSGGNRRICAPKPMLRKVQSWIHSQILTSPGALKRIHRASTAYSPKSSIIKNALAHAGCSWLVKVDIKDFFESISERQVYYVFRSLGYPALLSFEMARLCTRVAPPRHDGIARPRERTRRWTNTSERDAMPYAAESLVGHLPQGAPTSAMLANLVAVTMDDEIQEIADACGAMYTRYADDIVLSLSNSSRAECNEILSSIAQVVARAGYRVNRKKTHISGPGARKIVTGLVVNGSIPRLTRTTREEIELALYHIRKHGLLGHMEKRHSKNPLGYLNHLTGLIHFARSVEKDFGDRAMQELEAVLQPHNELLAVLRTLSGQSSEGPYYFV